MKTYKLSPTQGTIPADKVVGRKKDIQKLEKMLESQSVVIEEIRRMGKTLFLQKYSALAKENRHVLYFTLQGVTSVNELIDILITELRNEQSYKGLKIAWDKILKIYNSTKPDIDIGDITFKLPEFERKWKDALAACLQDIAHRKKKDKETLVIILDELPIMIWNWIVNGKAEQAKEFLDVLRKHRQLLESTGSVRFVVCGSIGMRVVLKRLKDEFSYTGEPFNDTARYSIGAMSDEEACFLCECLFLDDFIIESEENKEELLKSVCNYAENLPFYINRLFSIIRNKFDDVLSIKNIESSYNILLNDPQESKVLKQLEDRITTYYHEEEANCMKAILSFISEREKKTSQKKILKEINFKEDIIKECLHTLLSENYLIRELNGTKKQFSFKYQIVKKWWNINMA
ncbi:ATP-binding protein [Kordia jejudonensis]|uniref:hypothetical protein n=1 Tax=Kordia jejudonensis TaxID=1348245 RepID=UPI0006290A90|nr:hypothetical protein [Kordia jejudonensis]